MGDNTVKVLEAAEIHILKSVSNFGNSISIAVFFLMKATYSLIVYESNKYS